MRKKRVLSFFIICGLIVSYFFFHSRTPFPTPEELAVCPLVHDVGCARVAIIPFLSFLNHSVLTACFTARKAKFALVIPTLMYNRTVHWVSLDEVRALVSVLQKYPRAHVTAGTPLVLNANEKPACSIEKRQWTLQLNETYSMFSTGTTSVSAAKSDSICQGATLNNITCYSCDLLPDIFVIRLSVVTPSGHRAGDFAIDVDEFAQLGESARLPLFLELKGHSAYCPLISILHKNVSKSQSLDYTCNSLRMIWDGHFVQIPQLIGVFRIISPESLDHWLGCTWAKMAFDSKLPIHCSNWVRQFTLDAVEMLERFGLDYRIVYGTLLGAVRSGDVVPWTVDGDIAVFGTWSEKFRYEQWPQIVRLSKWRYSNLDRYGDDHYGPDRLFPTCPIRLTYDAGGREHKPPTNQIYEIGRVIRESKSLGAVFSYEHQWRSTGYVDLYDGNGLPDNCTSAKISLGPVNISWAGRSVKTVPDPIQVLQCLYGETEWSRAPPLLKDGWNSFSDAVQ